jgi:GTP-binding protein
MCAEPRELKSCATLRDLPKPFHPEIAFAGRSNAGKSSLINGIVGRRIAPISNTPGKTRTLRLYLWQPARRLSLCLVDLPGYGWAQLPSEVRARWHPMVEGYLTTRPTLCGVVIVADLRRGCTPLDHDMAGWLRERGMPFIVVATKADKVSQSRRYGLTQQLAEGTGVPLGEIVQFSALTKEGTRAVREALTVLPRPPAGGD